MIDKILDTDYISEIADECLDDDIKQAFISGSEFTENKILNAFYRSCDDMGIGYDKQQRILEGIINYI